MKRGAISGGVAGLVGWGVATGLGALGYAATSAMTAGIIGALSGAPAAAAGQVAYNLLTPGRAWDEGVIEAAAIGGAGGFIFGAAGWKVRQWWAGLRGAGQAADDASSSWKRLPQDADVNPEPPGARPLNRPVGSSPNQNAQVRIDIGNAEARSAGHIRVDQQQVNAGDVRVGINRPDLQYTQNGVRVYIEYDTSTSGRGIGHMVRILSNDPDGVIILKIID